jgi:hypothetical protein
MLRGRVHHAGKLRSASHPCTTTVRRGCDSRQRCRVGADAPQPPIPKSPDPRSICPSRDWILARYGQPGQSSSYRRARLCGISPWPLRSNSERTPATQAAIQAACGRKQRWWPDPSRAERGHLRARTVGTAGQGKLSNGLWLCASFCRCEKAPFIRSRSPAAHIALRHLRRPIREGHMARRSSLETQPLARHDGKLTAAELAFRHEIPAHRRHPPR